MIGYCSCGGAGSIVRRRSRISRYPKNALVLIVFLILKRHIPHADLPVNFANAAFFVKLCAISPPVAFQPAGLCGFAGRGLARKHATGVLLCIERTSKGGSHQGNRVYVENLFDVGVHRKVLFQGENLRDHRPYRAAEVPYVPSVEVLRPFERRGSRAAYLA